VSKFNLTYSIIGSLRRLMPRTEAYANTIAEARVEMARMRKDGATSKRANVFFECAACLEMFKRTDVHVDHITPVGPAPKLGTRTWDDYIGALFCDESNLQVLCRDCHHIKTIAERGVK